MTSNYEIKENRCGHWVVFSTRYVTKTGEKWAMTVYATKEEAEAKVASWNEGNIW